MITPEPALVELSPATFSPSSPRLSNCNAKLQSNANPRVSTFRQYPRPFQRPLALELNFESPELKPGYNQYNPSRVYLRFWLPYCKILLYKLILRVRTTNPMKSCLNFRTWELTAGLRGNCEPNFNYCIL